ncbi:MAG: T9SS type A sorting domain-containing protein [Bacteroidia bacterium]|nr:T9SS type A sorting domain-containing protein [Bacteroidia bacterium]
MNKAKHMKHVEIKLLLIFYFIRFNCYSQSIIYVPDDQQTIQTAIDTVSDGDTVIVRPGTYYENINFNGKNIVLGSLFLLTGDTSYILQTFIDGNHNGYVVRFGNNEPNTAILCGFTITNGGSEMTEGGGIFCYEANPFLKNLIIKNNLSYYNGGGIYIVNSNNFIIQNSLIIGNQVYGGGGGIYCINSTVILKDVTISNNLSFHGAGGVFVGTGNAYLKNVLICKNQSYQCYGAGIFSSNAVITLVNVTITDNGFLEYGYGIENESSSIIIINSILWNNKEGQLIFYPTPYSDAEYIIAFSDIDGGMENIDFPEYGVVNWLEGNINADPVFVDSVNSDYHLNSNSPCINSATSFYVLSGDTIVNLSPDDYSGFAPDMGAYEYDQTEKIDFHKDNMTYEKNMIYPNPNNGNMRLVYYFRPDNEGRLVICTMQGIHVVNYKLSANNNYIFDNNVLLENGMYIYKIYERNLLMNKGKLIIVK